MKRLILSILSIFSIYLAQAQYFHWAGQFVSDSANLVSAMAYTPDGFIIIGGTFKGVVDFDPGDDNAYMSSNGKQDVYVAKMDSYGDLIWVKQIGGPLNDFTRDVFCDQLGNIFITGGFEGTVDMDPGDETMEFTSLGGKDIFLTQLDANGDFVWAGQFGGPFDGTGTGVRVAQTGNIYFSGYYIGAFDFDPGSEDLYLTATGQSVFVLKLDVDHNLLWADSFGSNQFDYCQNMCIDEMENVYTIGSFKGVADFDPGDSTYYVEVLGSNDAYVHKLNSEGEFVWVRHMGGSSDEIGQAIIYDGNGNLFFTGDFQGTVDFDLYGSGYNLDAFGNRDVFLGKMDVDGNLEWVRQMGGTENEAPRGIALDDYNNVYTVGYFAGTADFDPGEGEFQLSSAGDLDAFVSKLDKDGIFNWAVNLGGADYDYSLAVVTDGQDKVYDGGLFSGSADFNPGMDAFYLTSQGETDSYICKLGTQLVGVQEAKPSQTIVYPNPVNSFASIDLGTVYPEVSVKVTDETGKIVFIKTFLNTSQMEIELDGDRGVYFAEINTGNTVQQVVKLIKN